MKKQLSISALQKKISEKNYDYTCFAKSCKHCNGSGSIKKMTPLDIDSYKDAELYLWEDCPACTGKGHLIKSDEDVDLTILENLHYYVSKIYSNLGNEKEKKAKITSMLLILIEYATYNKIDLDKELKVVL